MANQLEVASARPALLRGLTDTSLITPQQLRKEQHVNAEALPN
jgi:hypothetical protein